MFFSANFFNYSILLIIWLGYTIVKILKGYFSGTPLHLPPSHLVATSPTNVHDETAANVRDETVAKATHQSERIFFFVGVSLFPIGYAFYKVLTVKIGSYWLAFVYPPLIIIGVIFLSRAIFRNKLLKIVTYLNFLFCTMIIVWLPLHIKYGVVDPDYHEIDPPIYREKLSDLANFFLDRFDQYPQDNSNYYYVSDVLLTDFKDYYDSKIDKNTPLCDIRLWYCGHFEPIGKI